MLNFRFNQTTTALLASLTLLSVASCSPSTPEADAPTNGEGSDVATTGEVNVYSSRHYDTDDQLYEEFTEQTGIEVNLIEGQAAELIERMQTEGENSPADVLITVDVGNLWRAQDSELLQAVDSEVLNQAVPATFRDDEGQWFALTKRARVIVYNQDNVDPSELSTYAALADEEWRDRICMRSSNNIYNQSLVAAKIAELGEEETQTWVEGLVANFARDPEGNDVSQLQSVAAGECDVTIANTYYVGRLIRSDDPADQEVAEQVGLFFPDAASGGTHVNISGAGVARNAPNAENAIAFLEFMVTPEAQEVFAGGNNEYPVVPEVEAHEVVKALGDFDESELKVEEYGELNATAVQVMDRAGWK